MYAMQTLHAGGIPMFRGTYLVVFVIMFKVKSVLHNLTDGTMTAIDSAQDQVRPHILRSPSSGGGGTTKKSLHVNDRMKDLHEQHFMQLLACLKCYSAEKTFDNLKAFGMYVVMNRVYFTAVYLVPNNEELTADHVNFLNAKNTGSGSRSLTCSQSFSDVQYHMMQTRGLNWLNAEHCRAMFTFIRYLICRKL